MKKVDSKDLELSAVVHLLAFISGTRLVSRLSAGYCLVQGISIILGDDVRFSGPAYATAMSVPGAPDIWGALLIGAGLLMVFGLSAGRDVIAAVGAFFASAWSALFAVAFAVSASRFSEANLTAMWVYGKDAVLFVILAVILRTYGKGRGEEKLWKRAFHRKNS
jgi:lysylphosphatidylglycerol synthetase-like protein (DUF2156 family)